MNKKIHELNRNQLREYIYDIQLEVQSKVLEHQDIDDFLDNSDIFNEFEEILPDQEFGILVLTVLNNFKSEVILNDLLDIIEDAIKRKINHE